MGKGDRPYLGGLSVGLALISLPCAMPARATSLNDPQALAARSREQMAAKVLSLSRSPELQEAANPLSKGGSKSYNANNGTPFLSRSTYHSYVWDYCLKWMSSGKLCEQWLPRYATLHGLGKDRSTLEAAMGDVLRAATRGTQYVERQLKNGLTQYGMFAFKTRGGSFLKSDGQIDTQNLTDWRLTPEARAAAEKVGLQTADRTISLTYDENARRAGSSVMANPVYLRQIAGTLTKIMRNRLYSTLGETRANQRGIESAQGEDIPTAEAYARELQRNPEPTGTEDRIKPQAELDPQTRVASLEQRMKLAKQAMDLPADAVNPTVQGDRLVSGNAESAPYDEVAIAANIYAIDHVGADPNQLPHPKDIVFTPDQYSQTLATYEVGGRAYHTVQETNWQQLSGYNQALRQAATANKAAATRSEDIADQSKKILGWQKARGSVDAVHLNGLTPQMKSELPRHVASVLTPKLESTPSQLVQEASQ